VVTIRRGKQSRAKSAVVPILGLGQFVLVVLKLTGVITWSWWLVMVPLLACAAFLMLISCALVALMVTLRWIERRRIRSMVRRVAPMTPEIVRLLRGDQERLEETPGDGSDH
jgi:hypothetical protein